MLHVAWDSDTWVPTAIYDELGTTKLFTITMPAFTTRTHPPKRGTIKPGIRPDFYDFETATDDAPWSAAKLHLRLSRFSEAVVPE